MRRIGRAGWILLLIGFGIFFGIDQAAKHEGQSPWEVHPSYWSPAGSDRDAADGTRSAAQAGPKEQAAAGRAPAEANSEASTAASGATRPVPAAGSGANGAQAAALGGNASAAARRAAASGLGTKPSAWGEPTSRTARASDSFLNRLGNKLGEAVRGFFSAVIGWIVGLFNQLLR